MAMQKRGLPIVKPYISPLTVFQTVRFQSSVLLIELQELACPALLVIVGKLFRKLKECFQYISEN